MIYDSYQYDIDWIIDSETRSCDYTHPNFEQATDMVGPREDMELEQTEQSTSEGFYNRREGSWSHTGNRRFVLVTYT
jgi:hypothetical protein